MNVPPAWMKDAEVLGNWLATRVKFAKNTSKRLVQVSRVDAVCWFLTLQVDFTATSKDVKRFATAFRTDGGHVGCCSLLNSCYGGVSDNFSGELGRRWAGNYGRFAPLFRPFPRSYAPTLSGIERASRVTKLLEG